MTGIDLEQIDLTGLDNDGDTLDLPDGRKLRLRIEPDQDYDPFGEDFYGKIAVVRVDPYDDYGYPRRPREFDGNAEKIWTYNRGEQLWWQPPADVKRNDPAFGKLREQVRDLASFGGYWTAPTPMTGPSCARLPAFGASTVWARATWPKWSRKLAGEIQFHAQSKTG